MVAIGYFCPLEFRLGNALESPIKYLAELSKKPYKNMMSCASKRG
jgi:hypothetical protein